MTIEKIEKIEDVCEKYDHNKYEIITDFIRLDKHFLDAFVFTHYQRLREIIEEGFLEEFKVFAKYKFESDRIAS